MHVTHSSGGNCELNANISNGAEFLKIFKLEVNLRVSKLIKNSNLIVVQGEN